MGLRVISTGSYLPVKTVTNDDLAAIVETNDEWIASRTGIRSRHMANGETTWYMGLMAAKTAVDRAGIDPADIGMIIGTTITSDFITPSMAAVIQSMIGAENAFAYDISAACTGFVYAMDIAEKYLSVRRDMKYVLIISAEKLSEVTNFSDRSSCILFGDGAGAAVVSYSDSLFSSWNGTDAAGFRSIYAKHTRTLNPFEDESPHIPDDGTDPGAPENVIVQDGKAVYRFATKALPNAVGKALEGTGLTPADIDIFVPHQANARIIETAAKHMGVPIEKFHIVLDHVGNTSSSSIPIALDDAVTAGKIKPGMKMCFVGFGAGLTSGAIIMQNA